MVRAINGSFDWSIDPIFHDIKILANDFETADFSLYIPQLNLFAHKFAKGSYSKDHRVGNAVL